MIEEAESEVESALLKLSFTQIRAPFDGIIDRIPNKIGSLIDEGTLMTTISDNSEVYAYFSVSEKEYLDFINSNDKSKAKKEVELILANGEKYAYSGYVETIEGEFEQGTGNISFRAKFPNPKKILKHGSSGKIRTAQKIEKALVIPQKSTYEVQDRLYVYTVNQKGIVETKSFVPKMRIPHLFIVDSGIAQSDSLIFEGIQELKVGLPIKTQKVNFKDLIRELTQK